MLFHINHAEAIALDLRLVANDICITKHLSSANFSKDCVENFAVIRLITNFPKALVFTKMDSKIL